MLSWSIERSIERFWTMSRHGRRGERGSSLGMQKREEKSYIVRCSGSMSTAAVSISRLRSRHDSAI